MGRGMEPTGTPATPSAVADNALYWIGECYFSQGDFPAAIRSFDLLLEEFPNFDLGVNTVLCADNQDLVADNGGVGPLTGLLQHKDSAQVRAEAAGLTSVLADGHAPSVLQNG